MGNAASFPASAYTLAKPDAYSYTNSYRNPTGRQLMDLAWQLTLLALLLLGLVAPSERGQRVRVALAMIGGSFAGIASSTYLPAEWVIWAYLAIDLAIAFVVLMRPATTWQRYIGACYAGMAMLTIGFTASLQFNSSAVGDPDVLKGGHDAFSWIALAILFLWGADGILGTVLDRRGLNRVRVPSKRTDT